MRMSVIVRAQKAHDPARHFQRVHKAAALVMSSLAKYIHYTAVGNYTESNGGSVLLPAKSQFGSLHRCHVCGGCASSWFATLVSCIHPFASMRAYRAAPASIATSSQRPCKYFKRTKHKSGRSETHGNHSQLTVPRPMPTAWTHSQRSKKAEAEDTGEHQIEPGAFGDEYGEDPVDMILRATEEASSSLDPRLRRLGWAGTGVGAHDALADVVAEEEGTPPLEPIVVYDAESGLLLRKATACFAPDFESRQEELEDGSGLECVAALVAEAVAESPELVEAVPAEWRWESIESVAVFLERFHPLAKVRVAAVQTLSRLKVHAAPAIGAVVATLADPSRKAREAAAEALRGLHHVEPQILLPYLHAIAGLLESPKHEVRLIVAQLLPTFQEHAIPYVDVLRARLDVEKSPALREAVILSLARLGDSEAADWVEEQRVPKPKLSPSERYYRMPVGRRPLTAVAKQRRETLRRQLFDQFRTSRS